MNQYQLYEQQIGKDAGGKSPPCFLGKREAALLQWIRSQLTNIPENRTLRFAELSVGDGQLSRGIARTVREAVIDCVDISPSRLAYSRQMAIAESRLIAERMHFLELNLDTEFDQLKRGYYDVVIAIDVLEHVFDPFEFIRHCREVLKPGGGLFLRVPNLAYVKRRLAMLCGKLPVTSSLFETPGSYASWKQRHGWDGGHLHFFTIDSLRWLLKEEGLECISWGDVGARAEAVRHAWPGMLFGNIAVFARDLRKRPDASAR